MKEKDTYQEHQRNETSEPQRRANWKNRHGITVNRAGGWYEARRKGETAKGKTVDDAARNLVAIQRG